MFLFGGLKSLLPKINNTIIDNHAFRLHYKLTTVVLIAFVILATSRENIGDPISCMLTAGSAVPEAVINQFCWVNATHSIPSAFDRVVGLHVAYEGVGPPEEGERIVYHKYYQWVVFMLFLQAVMFYVPRYFWKMWEGGKMKMLLLEMNCPIIEEDEREKKLKLILDYFVHNVGTHNGYLYKYVTCEVSNLFNVLGQIYLTDRFLGWEFLNFGTRVLRYISDSAPSITDPMIRVFPRLTKCTFYNYGFGGTLEQKDALCVLPLNIVNEKIYIFLWFWFITLTVISAANIVYRVVTLLVPSLRVLLLHARVLLVPSTTFAVIVGNVGVGDWFVLYLLSKNMHHVAYGEFAARLAESLRDKKSTHFVDKFNAKNEYL